MSERITNVLVLSPAFPSNADASRGVFVFQRVRAISQLRGVEVRVVSPTPWAPPLKSVEKFEHFSKLPMREVYRGITIDRPRYLLPPKVGGYFHPQLMYSALLRTLTCIRKEFDFDIIDSHWVYPAGVAATRLSQHFCVPVSLTGRGEDMVRFPSMPFKGKSIRWALEHADACIGVSEQISTEMVRHGSAAKKVATIANGVDTDTFRPLSQRECRTRLGLPVDRQILMTVGDRLELKGFHVVIEALPKILESHPDVIYVCVGGPGRHGRDFTPEIERLIRQLGLEDRVMLVGPKPHDDLVHWYNAADLYLLASSREGSPNVLLEALSCGTPAVGTPVGGASDELQSEELGFLLKERTPEAAADAIVTALDKAWDRERIRETMKLRSWTQVAQSVADHWCRVVGKPVGHSTLSVRDRDSVANSNSKNSESLGPL